MDEFGVQYYECNICFETARDAVVTRCGHLYCWPCLHRWFLVAPSPKCCPVCTALVDVDRIIPIYAGNNTEDPRKKNLPDAS